MKVLKLLPDSIIHDNFDTKVEYFNTTFVLPEAK